MLAFSYTSGNASVVNLCTCTDKKQSIDLELELCSHQREYATHGTRSPWIPGFTRFGGATSEPTTKQDVEIKTGENEEQLNECRQNIFGPVAADDVHIVSVIAELLGADSYACECIRVLDLRISLTLNSYDSKHLPIACAR